MLAKKEVLAVVGHKKENPTTLGVARRMPDPQLVSSFFEDRSSRSVYERVIQARMLEDGFVDFFRWVWTYKNPGTVPNKTSAIQKTPSGQTLAKELQGIYESGYAFSDTDDPERCREFCSVEGNVYNKTEEDLSVKQRGFLGLIRDRYRSWMRKQSA